MRPMLFCRLRIGIGFWILCSAALSAQEQTIKATTSNALPATSPAPADSLGRVELIRDRWGVPHIIADSDQGAFYGLGFATAEDRGFQMVYNLRYMQGRLSEIFGRGTENEFLNHDRKLRTLGFYRAAREVAAQLDPHTQHLLEAYSRGVNDWFAQHADSSHPLFSKLDIHPEPWTVADCISSWWYLAQFFSTDGLHKLDSFRRQSEGDLLKPPLVIVDDEAAIVQLGDVSSEWTEGLRRYQEEHGYAPRGPAAVMDSPSFSHAWVVGGNRSSTGSSILVSDPQLPVSNPSLLYEFHVCGSSINARGAGIPGSPGLLIGFNQAIAWGLTALGADQADLFRLKTDASHPDQYQVDEEWLDMQVVQETIKIRGENVEELEVRRTMWGPVVNEWVDSQAGDPDVALRRIPLCETERETIQGVLQMMAATDLDSFIDGLSQWQFPSVNVVFGDREGNIGYWMQAALPARSRFDLHAGELAVDGSSRRFAWQGFLPHDLLPHVINPKRGWIASGNHRPIASFYPLSFAIGKGSTGHSVRSWRLYERLAEQQMFDPADVLAIHFDDVSPMRRDIIRIAQHARLNSEFSADAAAALDLLHTWQEAGAHSDLNQSGSALALELSPEFRAHRTPLAVKYGGGQAGLTGFLRNLIAKIEGDPHTQLSREELEFIDAALAAAWNSAQQKYGAQVDNWEKQARSSFRQQRRPYYSGLSGLDSIDAAADLFSPELDCIDAQTIKSQAHQGYTQYVPLHNTDEAQSILPPGQSERLDSPWRQSTWALWERGALHPAPLSEKGARAIAVQTVILQD